MSRSAGLPEPRYRAMTVRSALVRFFQQEDINFLLTNRVPRRLLTQFMGWFSQIEQPVVRALSIGIWRLFADLDLGEAKSAQFRSMHDCFIRELKDGARPIDPDPAVLVSPCDAIVGAYGRVERGVLIQAKGQSYTLAELLGDPELVRLYRQGCYVTLRLSSGMYHRFHAPHDCRIRQVTYIGGDTWNVNPIALKRVEKLFCRNERVLLPAELDATGDIVTLVPVAAILVASIRLHFVDVLLHLKYPGPNLIPCDAVLRKGDEMGWFQHGSTLIVLAPGHFTPCANVVQGATVRMGQPLLRAH
jgi:phosphatidylserine decarboxylase